MSDPYMGPMSGLQDPSGWEKRGDTVGPTYRPHGPPEGLFNFLQRPVGNLTTEEEKVQRIKIIIEAIKKEYYKMEGSLEHEAEKYKSAERAKFEAESEHTDQHPPDEIHCPVEEVIHELSSQLRDLEEERQMLSRRKRNMLESRVVVTYEELLLWEKKVAETAALVERMASNQRARQAGCMTSRLR